jgi:hypothetical protein
MSLSNEEIDQKLNSLLNKLGHKIYLINPFFRISKATPDQMAKYRDLKLGFRRLRILLYLLIFFPINICKIIFFFILSIIYMYQNRIFSTLIAKADYIFLSHGIGTNIIDRKADQFFGTLPKYFASKKGPVSIVYTNHFRKNFRKHYNELFFNRDAVHRNLLPKFLKPRENLGYIKVIVKLSLTCLIKGFKDLKSDPISAYIYIKGSVLFYGRATYNNYLLSRKIQLMINHYSPKLIMLTFEGHSYEQYLFEKISNLNPKIICALYQHSPIVSNQFGVNRFLESNKNKVKVLTTGKFYANSFRKISSLPDYKVIGTSKSRISSLKVMKDRRNLALFVPEGTHTATIIFLKLIRKISDGTSYLLSIRLHPHLRKNFIIRILIKIMVRNFNLHVSSNTLHEDLTNAKFVFYRSSAVGIETLKYEAIPVFYGTDDEKGLNVLEEYSFLFPSARNKFQILNCILSKNNLISRKKKKEILNYYFTKLDFKNIDKFLGI